MVLILVLVIVMLVSLAGFSFVATVYNEEKATRLRGEEVQAKQLAHSAVVLMSEVATKSPDERERVGGLDDNEDLFRGVVAYYDEAQRPQGRFSIIAPRFTDGQPAGIRFGMENESAKLDLRALLAWDRRTPGTAAESLRQLPGMTDAIADAILDWMDADGARRPLGAESEFYHMLDHPYAPRNAPVECIEELLLVRGVTREKLYGWDTNRNYFLDPGEQARAESAAELASFDDTSASIPWASLLTVYSAERNVDPEGKPRINLNHKNLSKLHDQLLARFGEPLASFVIAYRQNGPYRGSANANTSPETVLDLSQRARSRFMSPLDLVNAQVRIRTSATRPRPVLKSPLNDEEANAAKPILDFLDYVTVRPEPILTGRINVTLASPQVLAAVPGMDPGTVRQIQVEREAQSGVSVPNRRHPVWLLLEGIVDLPGMKKLDPFLTCGGSVYRAQVVGYLESAGPTARAEVVIDATQTPARQLYWKDLRILGRGFSRDVLSGDSSGSLTNLPQGTTPTQDLDPASR